MMLLAFCSAAANADLVISDTWRSSSISLTFSLTMAVPMLSFSLSPILWSMEATVAEAFDDRWCLSSNDLALLRASFPNTNPFASIVLTTSSVFFTAVPVILTEVKEGAFGGS
ncbi:hypothetical protein MIMGU_mgv1a016669mg [Erythranthe guttata]|uniref:Uncharacterized protein n=1 Tax=Erythranthe guttata TaxID=4155 RepID=A0A022QUE5_ERYGU|nr:hypothetical protein MIMGU_mgv1a016669mg [Erythranthe guttata]